MMAVSVTPNGTNADASPTAIPSTKIVAIEHPCIVRNIDKALKTFGRQPNYANILESSDNALPIFLDPSNEMGRPIISHPAPSHNVVLKIIVPKRTGRKRKRGSDGPFSDSSETEAAPNNVANATRIKSLSLDAADLQRRLQDNIGSYVAEPVGLIEVTHRYRGMADYSIDTKHSAFARDFTDKVMSGDVSKFREFSLASGTAKPPNIDMIPPPIFSSHNLPYTYDYSQNIYTKTIENEDGSYSVVNTTAPVKSVGFFISMDDPTPMKPVNSEIPYKRDPLFKSIIDELLKAMDERPVWTRRSILNRIGGAIVDPKRPNRVIKTETSQTMTKTAIQFIGYQFKGGPWRDALVRYGYDPRKIPEARQYQTIIFRLHHLTLGGMGEQWQEIRRRETAKFNRGIGPAEHAQSHVFDGKNFTEDGKVWQVCDITDPLIQQMVSDAPFRPECDTVTSGWFHKGSWAKIRAVVRCKMRAIQFGREIRDSAFRAAARVRDETPEDTSSSGHIFVPIPDLKLTEAEMETIRGTNYGGRKRGKDTGFTQLTYEKGEGPAGLKKKVNFRLHRGLTEARETRSPTKQLQASGASRATEEGGEDDGDLVMEDPDEDDENAEGEDDDDVNVEASVAAD